MKIKSDEALKKNFLENVIDCLKWNSIIIRGARYAIPEGAKWDQAGLQTHQWLGVRVRFTATGEGAGGIGKWQRKGKGLVSRAQFQFYTPHFYISTLLYFYALYGLELHVQILASRYSVTTIRISMASIDRAIHNIVNSHYYNYFESNLGNCNNGFLHLRDVHSLISLHAFHAISPRLPLWL